jgi:ligand-binding sensor domain-containing protein
MKKVILTIAILSLVIVKSNFAQQPVWRDHLPYNKTISVADAGDLIYCATPYSLFSVRKTDKTIERINKTTVLSDIGISAIGYSNEYRTLLIAYENTNIDLIKNGEIGHFTDIINIPILGNKTINKVICIGKYAYLSCGFGILVVDITNFNNIIVHDTYYIGPLGSQINVLDLAFNPINNQFFAATESGIYRADSSDNLASYISWKQDTSLLSPNGNYNLITTFTGRVYVNLTPKTYNSFDQDTMLVYSNGVWDYFQPEDHSNKASFRTSQGKLVICANYYLDVFDDQVNKLIRIWNYDPGNVLPNDALIDSENNVWIADKESGLMMVNEIGNSAQFLLNGPYSANAFAMDAVGNDLWAVYGGRDVSFQNLYNPGRCYSFTNCIWNSYTSTNTPFLDSVRDILTVAIDPRNPKHVFLGSWGFGLFEYLDGEYMNTYNLTNSTLQYSVDQSGWLGIGGMCYDTEDNLWMTNSSATNILSVLRNNTAWKSFNLGTDATGVDAGSITIDKSGLKWILQRDHSVLVFNDNNTIDNTTDDQVKRLSGSIGNGALPGQYVQTISVDNDGEVWIGTDQGIGIIHSPENIFTGGNFDCIRLLESETITAIAIDGDNRKWIGTDNNGLYLLSENGIVQINHYTIENSPLFSNSISSLAILSNGIVYIGTSNGMLSYNEHANGIEPSFGSKESLGVKIFPNPSNDYVSVEFVLETPENVWIILTDISGSVILKESINGLKGENHKMIYVDHLTNGIYLLNIQNNNNSVFKKILKL